MNHPDPIRTCPCGGELRLFIKTEDRHGFNGSRQDRHVEHELGCAECDDWEDEGCPSTVTQAQYDVTMKHFVAASAPLDPDPDCASCGDAGECCTECCSVPDDCSCGTSAYHVACGDCA